MKQRFLIILCLLCCMQLLCAADPDSGGTLYECDTSLRLEATPADGYHFVCWSDGNTDNPRDVTVTAEVNYAAVFALDDPDLPTGISTIAKDAPRAQKVIHNYQLFILRDGKTYTIQGQKVK